MANFQTVPYNFIGGTYQSRSRPVSSQRTVNMYQQVNPAGKDQFVLYSFPGQKFISEVKNFNLSMVYLVFVEANGIYSKGKIIQLKK